MSVKYGQTMEKILINKDFEVRVDTFDWQISPTGKLFKTIGLSTVGEINEKWIDRKKINVNDMLYHFKYEDGSYFDIQTDYKGKFIQLIKNPV